MCTTYKKAPNKKVQVTADRNAWTSASKLSFYAEGRSQLCAWPNLFLRVRIVVVRLRVVNRGKNPSLTEIPGQTGQTRELISPGLTGLTWNYYSDLDFSIP